MTMCIARHVLVIGLIFACVAGLPALSMASQLPIKPEAGGLIYDGANVLSQESHARLDSFVQLFCKEKGIEFYAVILPGTGGEGVDRMASGIVEEWKVGAGKGGRGLLFLLSLEDKAVRFEVTYASEGVYTDAFISYIEHEQMAPFFEQGRVLDGVEATLELIVARAREHMAKGSYDPAINEPNNDLDFQAGGAGAHSHVDVGKSRLPSSISVQGAQRGSFSAGETPEAAFLSYLERDHQRVTDPDLGLFTPATRAMLSRWTITNAQLDNEYQVYSGRSYKIITEGDRAVVRFAIDERTLSPFFLTRAPEGWQIDLALMGGVVRFNHRNEWHFASQNHPYMFAFHDCVFDANGYPFLRKNAAHGPRAFLGISYFWHNYQGQGVLVYRVIPGAAAEMAGVRAGDYIMTYNGHPLYKPRDLDVQLASSRPGDAVALEIVRGADDKALTINLGNEGEVVIQPTRTAGGPIRERLSAVLGSRDAP